MAITFGEQGNIENIFREQGNIGKIILGNIAIYFRGTREHCHLLKGNKGTWTPPGRASRICHDYTIITLTSRFQLTGTVKDRQRTGQPRITTRI